MKNEIKMSNTIWNAAIIQLSEKNVANNTDTPETAGASVEDWVLSLAV